MTPGVDMGTSGRRLPSFDGATGWLNSPPLTPGDLHAKVVLVDFWTYTCVNWLRQLPYVRAWADRYADAGLVVIGVHTPEFSFEHEGDHVRRAVRELRVGYPVAIDNDYAVWRAFGNRYWPALYIADAQGRLRHEHFGEGEYERTEAIVQQLLGEAGSSTSPDLVSVDARGAEAPADWATLASPENYTGYGRTENFASVGGIVPDQPASYTVPDLRLNQWALAGDWTITEETVRLDSGTGRIACRFRARDLNLVMGPAASGPVEFQVRLDGAPPRAAHGTDTDRDGRGTVVGPRLYQLVRQQGPVLEHTFEITFLHAGAEAYVFTFG